MKATLKNGTVIEGTPTEVKTAVRELDGYAEKDLRTTHYDSHTHGLVSISGMNNQHLQNAIAKKYAEWANSLRGSKPGPKVFLRTLTAGPTDVNLNSMIAELSGR